jgi:hypothetical protein
LNEIYKEIPCKELNRKSLYAKNLTENPLHGTGQEIPCMLPDRKSFAGTL